MAKPRTRAEKVARRERRLLRTLLARERALWDQGLQRIAGVDEAGVGPLAGPVIAAAVVFPPGCGILGANDSKQLAPETRERLEGEIWTRALSIGIGLATVEEIDRVNILQAGLLAMRRALTSLREAPEHVLVDARTLPELPWSQEARIHGDATLHCVACASIVAKVHRDRLMQKYDRLYPGYGFARHKGYATPEHVGALRRLGPSPIHRQTFHWEAEQLTLFGPLATA